MDPTNLSNLLERLDFDPVSSSRSRTATMPADIDARLANSRSQSPSGLQAPLPSYSSNGSTPRRSFDSDRDSANGSGSGGEESYVGLINNSEKKKKQNRGLKVAAWCFGIFIVLATTTTLLVALLDFEPEGGLIPVRGGARGRKPERVRLPYNGTDYTIYVDPMTGVEGGGNMFPGVTMPFGVVKAGIDMDPPGHKGGDAYSGYLRDGHVLGFSLMHESGTGGAPKYGVVAQLPVTGDISNPLEDLSVFRAKEDTAEVGLYTSYLKSGVVVNITAAHHIGALRHTFPADTTGNVVVDVSHYLTSYRGQGLEQHYLGGEIHTTSNGDYRGFGIYDGGWNMAPAWKVYFCGKFLQKPAFVKTFRGDKDDVDFYDSRSSAKGQDGESRVGAVFTFEKGENATTIESRIGISFISERRACEFLEDEGSEKYSFDELVQDVKREWNREVLSTIQTTETNLERLRLLYTAMYGMFLIPSDRTGENPLWDSEEPYYDDIFTLWDIFRCHSSLNHLLLPDRYEGQIRSMIDIWRHDGYMPEGRSSNFNGRVQGGSNSDNVLADAFVKGMRGKVNWEDGFKAMVKNAEVQPPNNFDKMAKDSSTKEGRGALPDWINLGYITQKYTRSVSRAVEYSLNDFSLAQVAKGLNKPKEAQKYLQRSRNWRNHWNPNASAFDGEVTGFVAPRRPDGSWAPKFNPLSCGGCYWGDDYYQGLPYEYSVGAHHDMETLIDYSGGPEKFTTRLERLFDRSSGRMLFNVGNEPSFASPYLFNFVGRQDLTAKTSRWITKEFYKLGKGGLPGNSDAGAMQSFLVWNILGFYPITGTTTFLIASPWLPEVVIRPQSTDSKEVQIITKGGQEEGAVYIQSVELNGRKWDKNWIAWGDLFEKGGEMVFTMGKEPKKWDTGELPPSYATGN